MDSEWHHKCMQCEKPCGYGARSMGEKRICAACFAKWMPSAAPGVCQTCGGVGTHSMFCTMVRDKRVCQTCGGVGTHSMFCTMVRDKPTDPHNLEARVAALEAMVRALQRDRSVQLAADPSDYAAFARGEGRLF